MFIFYGIIVAKAHIIVLLVLIFNDIDESLA